MKTVNLELSKQLKEAGYPQLDGISRHGKPTEYAWVEEWYWDGKTHDGKSWTEGEIRLDTYWNNQNPRLIAVSPTADEILERLPVYTKIMKETSNNLWQISLATVRDGDATLHYETEPNLADAAAKMWLYLNQNELLV